jgi:glycosyltransferase involved in cell wall biosynthesis
VPLTVGIDGRAFSQPVTGISRYIRELSAVLDAALPDARFVIYSPVPIDPPVDSSRWEVRLDASLLGRQSFVWLKTRVEAMARRDPLDVFWANATFLPRLRSSVPTLSVVYDLTYRVAPRTMRGHNLWQYRAWFARDVRAATTLVTISEGTSARLAAYTGRRADLVVRPGVHASFAPPTEQTVVAVRRRHGLASPYFLSVATWEPRKNLAALVAAHADLGASQPVLALVGGRGWKDERVADLVSASGGRVVALGYVPDADLPALYAGAEAFAYPSRYEGFGIPVLEARACGARIVASDLPEIREAGGDGPLYVAPTRAGLREGLAAVAQGKVRRSSVERASVSWEARGDALAKALEKTAGRP